MGLMLSSCASSLQTFSQARIPAAPVAQLALPELTMTARTWPWLLTSEPRPTSMGAAVTRFLVKSAAALVGRSARMSARSGLPLALMPAVTEENLKPLGRKIGPDSVISGVSPENQRARAESQTWATLPSPWQLHRNSDSEGKRSNPC